jgi:hypothetical protein
MRTMIEREQYLRQQTLKVQREVIVVVVTVLLLLVLLITVAPHRQAFRSALTNTLSSAPDSSILATPARSQAARRQTNPFQGFRNVGSGQ